MKLTRLAHCLAKAGMITGSITGFALPAQAQQQSKEVMQKVEITGSSIKRTSAEGALPLEIITRKQLEAAGIVTAEQLIATLNVNGNGSDNLASNADVTTGAQRGNNGASSANLRGQGADSTLVLLNGRRIATHGMKGAAVDLNSIPMAAVERVEILKDGASAIYGTDAIGGVINFILRKNFQGIQAQTFADLTQSPGGDINRVSLLAGFGNLDSDNYNVLLTASHSENQALRGDQRDFVNTFQPDRGLSVDTRGTPFATVFATSLGNTILSNKSNNGPLWPGSNQSANAINILNLPGAAGCNSIDGMSAYDYRLWDQAASRYACAWDTGRAAVLQQSVKNNNFVSRATLNIGGGHQVFAELLGSRVEVAKSFSPNQISPGSSFPASSFYPKTGAAYDMVFNAIAAQIPSIRSNYGLPIAYRWRCMECGNREINTSTDAARLQLGADGQLGQWDYRVGLSRAYSESQSTLGSGYNYTNALASALGSGLINPFLLPGQKQSQAAMDLINSTSAKGVVLYGGKTTQTQADAAVSGALWKLPAGPLMAAFGTDLRREQYSFNGDARAANARPAILNAPFDDTNALPTVSRDIRALYAEFLIPVFKSLELTVAGRQDHYSGFGNTFNPKLALRYTPVEQVLLRASYNSGFRAPSFNQLFNGVTESPYSGKDLVDPATCAGLKADSNKPGCAVITPNILSGGKASLGPETAKQASLGVVWAPLSQFSMNLDLWEIRKENSIMAVDLNTLLQNYSLFKAQFIRDAGGNIVQIDQRWVNAGASLTRGIEVGASANGKLWNGKWTAGIDGSYLLEKKSRPNNNAPYGSSEVGRYTYTGDLGLRWKHSAYFSYSEGNWSSTLTQIFRSGYKDQVLPGVANGLITPANYNPDVKSYSIFNLSVTYNGFKNLSLSAGIKNLFNTDPPFAINYDSNSGAGSSWEPRVADPRGRSVTMMATYTFK